MPTGSSALPLFGYVFLTALILAYLLTFALLRVAPALGLMDHPDKRKDHARPTPKGGGIAICLSVLLIDGALRALNLGPTDLDPTFLWCEVLGVALVVVGLIDDIRPLSWQLRLGVQMVLATLLVFGSLAGLEWWVRGLAWFWIVGLTNAYNMLDNMDGLSGGVAFITAGFLALVALARSPTTGWEAIVLPLVVLMAAVAGFLRFNVPPARIFMGDAGSTYLGFILAVRSLGSGPRPNESRLLWLAPLCICAVPCYDLFSVVLIRLSQGRSPFHADKQHLSHRLVQRGLSSTTAVLVIYLFAVASGLSGLLLVVVAPEEAKPLVVLQLAVWWAALAAIEFFTHRKAVSKRQPLEGVPLLARDEIDNS